MGKKKMKKVIPFTVMTTMVLSATLPAFAASGFVFEDWDLGIVSERKEKLDDTDDAIKRRKEWQKLAASSSELMNADVRATSSELRSSKVIEATPSQLIMPRVSVSASLGNLWENWDVADLSFLDGTHGLGTKQKPYQIRTKHQLMGLSFLAAFGMQPDYGEVEEEIVGDYRGAWFELTANIDLGGMDWNSIGYYRDDSEFSGEVTHPFTANLDGNGYKISNFRFAGGSSPNVGFFGALDGAEIRNLTLEPGKPVKGVRQVGILAGNAKNSKIFNCQVKGDVEGTGAVGGMIGRMEGSTVENGMAQVTVRTTGRAAGAQALAGGIAGEAADDSRIIDCQVRTGDRRSAGRCPGPPTGRSPGRWPPRRPGSRPSPTPPSACRG